MRRLIVSTWVVSVLLALSISAVSASPIKSPNADPFPIACEDGSYVVVTMGSGAPGHIVEGGSGNLVALAFTWQVYDDGELVYEAHEQRGKKRGLQGRLMHCTLEYRLSPEDIAQLEAELGIDLSDTATSRLVVSVLKTASRSS